jgi:LysM repeat protein
MIHYVDLISGKSAEVGSETNRPISTSKEIFMKHIRLILLALIFLLTACERPAPTGDIATPASNPEIIPRDDAYPIGQPTATAVPAGTTSPTDTSGEATDGSEPQPTGGEAVTPTDSAEVQPGEDAATDAPPALEDGVYVVRSGDTLGQIAFIYNVSVEDIMAANGLTNPDILEVGQQLTIPEAGIADSPTASTPTPSTETPGEPGGQEIIHIVQAGDNLFRIGLRYGFTVDELAEYNGIVDVNNLEVGQEIRIPPSN